MKVALSGFADGLIAQDELLANPVKDIAIPHIAARPPRLLSLEQRFALKNVVERATRPTVRKNGRLLRATCEAWLSSRLRYYAGLRVLDVSHLRVCNTHIGPKIGWILPGHKREM